jgi:hypothetical protein
MENSIVLYVVTANFLSSMTETTDFHTTHLFICCLFNDAVSSSDYTGLNNRIINE